MKPGQKKSIKINLGCGLCVGQDWENFDGSFNAWLANYPTIATLLTPFVGSGWKKWPKGIKRVNLAEKLDFTPESVDAVYSSHFFEHVPYNVCREILQQCFSILKRGGYLRLIVPDLEGLSRKYLRELEKAEDIAGKENDALPANKFYAALHCHSTQLRSYLKPYDWYQRIFDYHTHFWMYDRSSMRALLAEAGFSDIMEKDILESQILDIDQVERPGSVGKDGQGFILEGMRP